VNGECSSRHIYKNKDSLNSELKKKKTNLTVIILSHNFRTHVKGINQMLQFNQEYECFVNVRNYDRMAQYYEQVDSSDKDSYMLQYIFHFYFYIFILL